MSINLGLILLISAFGFVSAAIIGSSLVNLKHVTDFQFPQQKSAQWLVAIPLTAFAGPYWVARESINGYFEGRFSIITGIIGAIISAFWSFCAGVFVVEFLHLIQIL